MAQPHKHEDDNEWLDVMAACYFIGGTRPIYPATYYRDSRSPRCRRRGTEVEQKGPRGLRQPVSSTDSPRSKAHETIVGWSMVTQSNTGVASPPFAIAPGPLHRVLDACFPGGQLLDFPASRDGEG
jgi:hypothetical protein